MKHRSINTDNNTVPDDLAVLHAVGIEADRMLAEFFAPQPSTADLIAELERCFGDGEQRQDSPGSANRPSE